jgi:hypothetical protein
MHSLTESSDNPVLAFVFVLVTYLYIRVTAAWIVGLARRYAERAADQCRVPATEDSMHGERR